MLANEKRLHLVEFREENDNFPRLVASPESGPVRTKDEIGHDEILDFEIISFDGHMPNYKPEQKLSFERLPTYQVQLFFCHHQKLFLFAHLISGRKFVGND
jgi:small subunit ribosomal protein S5